MYYSTTVDAILYAIAAPSPLAAPIMMRAALWAMGVTMPADAAFVASATAPVGAHLLST